MNQKGIVGSSALILMPLFLVILAIVASAYFTFRLDSQTRHICRVELLKSQSRVARSLEELLKLNSQASALRVQRQIAELNFQLAPPQAKPAAKIELERVKLTQRALEIKQKLLLNAGRTESQLAPAQTFVKVQSQIAKSQRIQADLDSSDRTLRRTRKAEFDVRPQQEGTPTPNYKPSSDFEKKQVMQVQWSLPARALLPQWMQSWGAISNEANLKGECSATLVREIGREKWISRLVADKS